MSEFDSIINNPDKYRLEITYTQVNRNRKGKLKLNTYEWKGNSGNYFYPASTIKLPMACMTLEKMNKTDVLLNDYIIFDSMKICDKYHYHGYDRRFHKVKEGETLIEISQEHNKPVEDITNINLFRDVNYIEADGILNITREATPKYVFRKELSNMLIFSDNRIFNHMYDYLGHEEINQRLQELKYYNACINRRLLYCDSTQNKHSIGFDVYCENDSFLYHENEKTSPLGLKKNNNSSIIGKAHYGDKGLQNEAKDFTYNNQFSLESLHSIITSLIYPSNFPEDKRFNINENSRGFLLKSMAVYPNEIDYQNNNTFGYREDGFTKYLFIGNSKEDIPSPIRIFNIVGQAYGFTTDCAYIIDLENQLEFFLSFTIYTNENNILGDSKYEYIEIAFPFAEKLGKLVYDYELKRKRKRSSDLNEIKKILDIN